MDEKDKPVEPRGLGPRWNIRPQGQAQISGVILGEVLDALTGASVSLLRDLGIKAKLGPFDLSIAVGQSRETVDERLKKIDAARQNMREALEAIDELGIQADRNKAELSTLAAAIAAAKDQKSTLVTEAQALEALKAIETEAVRKALGVPTKAQRWAERGIAFLLGVLGSYVASVLWQMTWPQ